MKAERRSLRLKECPACPHCGHERGYRLRGGRRVPKLGACLRERWQCAPKSIGGCGRLFTSWNTTTRPTRAQESVTGADDAPGSR